MSSRIPRVRSMSIWAYIRSIPGSALRALRRVTARSGTGDFGLTFASKLAAIVALIGTNSCLAWVLGPSGRGSYAVAMLVLGLSSVVFRAGGDVAAMYFVSSKKLTLNEGVTNATILCGVGSLLAIGLALIIRLPLLLADKASPETFYLAFAGIPVMMLAEAYSRVLTSVGEFKWYALCWIARSAALLVFTLLFVLVLPWGVEGAMFALWLSAALATVLPIVPFRRRHGLRLATPSLRKLWQMTHYGLRYVMTMVSSQLNFRIGTLVLVLFAAKEKIGLFAAAVPLTVVVTMIPNTLLFVLTPRVAADPKGRPDLVAWCARVTAVLSAGFLVGLSILARPIVRLVLGPEFLPIVPLIWIISVGLLARAPSRVFGSYMVGTNHPGFESIAVAAGTVGNAVLLWLLWPTLDLYAAAVGMTAGYLITSAMVFVGFGRMSRMSVAATWKPRWADWRLLRNYVASPWRRPTVQQPVTPMSEEG